MTYSASSQPNQGFWETEILDMLFPRSPAPSFSSQDGELVRQFGFVPGLKEILMVRQVHALEHATVWVLSNLTRSPRNSPMSWFGATTSTPADDELLGGMSTERGFYLYGEVDPEDLSRAVQTALRRLTSGEWELAVHPRCGTNLSVGIVLTTSLTLGAAFLLPRGPIEQILGMGAAALTAAYLTPELGLWAQRYITTAIPFNLAIANISSMRDPQDRPAHFVEVRWVE